MKQDRELPYSMGFGFKARARDPSRSRDPWDSRHDDKGKGKGKGKGKSKGKEEANDPWVMIYPVIYPGIFTFWLALNIVYNRC